MIDAEAAAFVAVPRKFAGFGMAGSPGVDVSECRDLPQQAGAGERLAFFIEAVASGVEIAEQDERLVLAPPGRGDRTLKDSFATGAGAIRRDVQTGEAEPKVWNAHLSQAPGGGGRTRLSGRRQLGPGGNENAVAPLGRVG